MLEEIGIWHGDGNAVNSFVDFYGGFTLRNSGKTLLKITCDGAFAFYVNGRLAGFGESADFPFHKEYHTFDITKYCKKENEIVFTVWHYGIDTQTYINAPAFLAFRIEEDGKPVLRSGRDIYTRDDPYFQQDLRKKITGQLGFSYCYDNTATETPFVLSDEYETVKAHDRKIANLKLYSGKPHKMTTTENGILVDLGKETVGFLDIDLFSPGNQKMTVAYGEHLRNGHVARKIGDRDFSVEVVLKAGDNKLLIPFRRLAGRYLEVFAEDLSTENIRNIGLRPVEYPVRRKNDRLDRELDQKIYDVCVRTLTCCMHEHYEDCPWREQALYTMDSRNQMLCGYTAFSGTAFERHSLVLIAKSLRDDGLLSICAPAGSDLAIPFFSLVYPVQVAEYVKFSKDRGILKEVGDVLRKIMETFIRKTDESGLIPSFPYPFWNFYEWSEGNHNVWEISRKACDVYEKRYDLILNCMFVHAAKHYDELLCTVTKTDDIKAAIISTFYDKKSGLFRSSDCGNDHSQLGNALALLVGLGDENIAKKLAECKNMTPITLSMTTFLYDALLAVDEKKYSDFVLSDIRRRYKKMLDAGATTFWETELGADDFDGAGSLCHGWSAMPIHYYKRLKLI